MNKSSIEIRCGCGGTKVVQCHQYRDSDEGAHNRYRCLHCGAYIESSIIINDMGKSNDCCSNSTQGIQHNRRNDAR